MNTKRTRLLVAVGLMLGVVLLAILACGGSGGEEPTPQGDAGATSAAATIAAQSAQLTLAAQAAQLTQAAGGGQEPAPQEPAGASQVTITASLDANCREGPLPDYQIVGALLKGQSSTVHGTNANKDWWYVENPKKPGEYCWVWGEITQVSGDVAALPIVEPPPLPIQTEEPEPVEDSTPTPTATEEQVSVCNPPYQIANVGPHDFEWQGQGSNARLRVRSHVYLTPACPGVPMLAYMKLRAADFAVLYTEYYILNTGADGGSHLDVVLAPTVGELTEPPTKMELIWAFDHESDGSDQETLILDLP